MSDFKIGDKVYLECEVREKDMSDDTYRLEYKDCSDGYSITDFVKDKVLHTPDEAYNKGLNDAWELARKIISPISQDGYTLDELKNILGKNVNSYTSMFNDFTPQEALAKVKAYEEERNEIKVGDVVKIKGGCVEAIVTKVESQKIFRLFKDGSCDGNTIKEDLEKTGKHFDSIDEFMKS